MATASSGDSKYLTGEARIVAVPDGRELARVIHDAQVYTVAFSPDGKNLVTASGEAESDFDYMGHKMASNLEGNPSVPASGDLAPGYVPSHMIRSSRGEARIMAAPDGRQLARITHDGEIRGAAFSADGKYLATASGKMACLWSTALDDMLRQLCAGHGRNLSSGEWRRYLGDLPWQATCKNWPTPED